MSKQASSALRRVVERGFRPRARRLAAATLVACLAITGVSLIAPGNEALAEKSSNKKSSKRKSYVLSPAIFKKMSTIHKLLEEEKFTEALALLEQLAKKKKLSSFETATVFQAFGFAYSSLSQYAKAAENFEKSLATDALHDQTLVNMRYNLAQLYMAEEEFPKAIAHLEQWLETASKPGPQGYYLLGAAHAQLGEAKQALPYVLKAVSSEPKFKESWQQLLLALHFELKQFNEAAEVLATLIEHKPKKSYLQQLQGVYSELGDEKKALAVMELSYRQGYLDSSSELRNLAHLYLYHEVPSLAAQVMVKGLAEGTIKGERKSWELLGDSWIHAREYKRALEPLHKAAELAEDGDVHLKLARIHLEDQDWKQARVSIEAALAKGELDNPGDAQLMLGISNAKTGRFDAARKAFRKASQSKSSQKSAASWLEHVDALEAAAAREH